MQLDEEAELFIYYIFKKIQKNSGTLATLVNKHGMQEQRTAYKEGVYAPVVRLSSMLSPEAMERCKKAEAKMQAECEAAFRQCLKPNDSVHPTSRKKQE